MRPVIWRSILLSLCVAGLPVAAPAQTIAKTLDELRLLVKTGETVSVTDASGRVTSGRLTTLSPSSLVLQVNGAPREMKEGDITSVSHRRSDSLGNGALWGLAVGAGLATTGFLISLGDDETEFDDRDTGWVLLAIGMYGGIGAGVGVGIDALVKKEEVIYERPRTVAARWHLAPVVSRRVQGARLSFTF